MNSVNTIYVSDKSNNLYEPGLCNLGENEISSRKRKGIAGLIITFSLAFCLDVFHYPNELRLLIFFPLFYSIICLYQARKKFCVYFGMKGIFNFDKIGKSTAVGNEEFIKLDRKLAIQMTLTCFLLALAITVIYYLLPF